jgi:hypothetical protein
MIAAVERPKNKTLSPDLQAERGAAEINVDAASASPPREDGQSHVLVKE